MSPSNDKSNLPAKMKTLEAALKENFKSIQSVLPATMDPSRFCRMAINAVLKNPALANCNKASFVMSVINAAEMGLEPSLGQAALVPYKGIVQCQPMYQGLMELARRSGQVKSFTAEVVREGDEFHFTKGLDPVLVHVPKAKQGAKLTHAYAVAKMTDGDAQFDVMDASEIGKIRKASPSANAKESPWNRWEEEMWKKSVVRRLCKMLPKSAELSRALDLDDMAMAGKAQPPVFADMSTSTIDVSEVAGEPEGEGEIQQPQEKKPEPEKEKNGGKLKKGEVSVGPKMKEKAEEPDPNVLVEECLALEEQLGAGAISKAKQLVEIDEAADLTMVSVDQLVSLKQLYRAALSS